MSWRVDFLAAGVLSLTTSLGHADERAALMEAVQMGDASEVKALLGPGTPPDAPNQFGVTPLEIACQRGEDSITKVLLAAGADPNRAGRGGERPLMIAARTGRAEVIATLLAAGAEVNATDAHGQSALMWSAVEGHAEATGRLLEAGAKRDLRLKSGLTPWLLAARNGHREVIDVLLDAGADVDAALDGGGRGRAPREGMSALLLAAENAHFELAARLLDAGADPNDMRSGFTALHALSWTRKPRRGDGIDGTPPPRGSGRMSSLEFVDELIKHGAKVDTELGKGPGNADGLGREGATPFLMAARTADLPLMKRLLAHGADPKRPNKHGRTPLLAASGVMLKPEADEAASEDEAIKAAAFLLEHGADIDAVDKNGDTVMHGAAYKQAPQLVRFFAEHGADPKVWFRPNRQGRTPLRIARGFRDGNFKPSAPTEAALIAILKNAGIEIPPTPARPGTKKRESYPADQ